MWIVSKTNHIRSKIKILIILIVCILFTIINQSILTVQGARPDVGFQDGISDCQSGTSDAINSHSNAGHHSAAYMEAYNRGLASCSPGSSSSVNSGLTSTGTNTPPNCNKAGSLGGLLGAGVGLLTGGPAGAVGGFQAGSTILKGVCETNSP